MDGRSGYNQTINNTFLQAVIRPQSLFQPAGNSIRSKGATRIPTIYLDRAG